MKTESTRHVLLCDDDDGVREALAFTLEEDGYRVTAVGSGADAIAAFTADRPDVVVTDLRMPNMNGIELTRAIAERDPRVPVVVITAFGAVQTAVEAMQAGAADFVQKPIPRDVMRMTLAKVLRHVELVAENASLRAQLSASADELYSAAEPMRSVVDLCDRVAPSDATVLIEGESGTGKELVAKRLHAKSHRHGQAFIALNCSALPRDLLESELFGHEKGAFTGAVKAKKGRFVEADGGTLFLDEIGDLPLDLQAKLLRVLQERVVDVVGGGHVATDVRIVAATHRDLQAMVTEGSFREDLFFRLHVVPIRLPPLRDRPGDIGPLFRFFLERASIAARREMPTLTPALLSSLALRSWPGNVRELENLATRLAVTTTEAILDVDVLPPGALLPVASASIASAAGGSAVQISSTSSGQTSETDTVTLPVGGVSLDALERAVVVAALASARGNQSQAARFLRVPRHVLLYRVEKYEIREADWQPTAGTPRAALGIGKSE